MPRSLLPAIVSACAVSLIAPALSAQQTVEEPKSHVAFPIRLSVPGGGTHLLMGTGLRTKTFLKVKVYAFGLYVDSAAARESMSAWAGKEHYEIEEDDSFYSALLQRDFAMTLRLVMTRNVDGETFAEAFDGALRPRVQLAAAEMNMPGGEAALDRFQAYFSVDEMTKESEIVLSCSPAGRLTTRVKGAEQPAIESPALCWALFDVYLGEDPISGDGKKSVTANFPMLLYRR